MPVRYVLDTNMASCIIKGSFPHVRERLLKIPMSEVAISVITEAELRFGLAKKPHAAQREVIVEEFLLRVEILAWDSEAAKSYAKLRADMERLGEPMGNLDMMIAAQALAAQAILVTHDRVFHRVKQLKIEDWTKAS
ncbi:MAG: type II toxin-antitoxin system VapC family toxin [Acidobacteriaceae bacterium]